jgi:hypothetical protein
VQNTFPEENSLLESRGLNPIFSTLWFNLFKGMAGRRGREEKMKCSRLHENEKTGL